MATPAYLRYANQGATRNLPLSPELASALGFLPELGVTAEVFSGGQAAKGSGGPRTGSVRHDHGNAADVRFYRDGRQLDWANPDDLPLFQEIVQRGKANGLTGFGAGPGYMGEGTMHVGFGSPGVWGAGGRSANAPDWLRQAYGEAPAGEVPASGGGQETAYGGAGDDRLTENPMQNNPGGLGGLGGWRGVVQSDGFGDVLTALGASLMGSPSNNPFEQFGTNLANGQALRLRRDAAEQDRADNENQRMALKTLLRSQGLSEEEANAYSGNSAVAGMAVEQAKENKTLVYADANFPEVAKMMRAGLSGREAVTLMSKMRNGGDATEYGLTPQYGVDANGNPVLIQIGKNGTSTQTPLPEGVSLSKEPIRLDAGTHFVLLDPITRQPVGQIAKENRQEAADTAAGTVEGRTAAEKNAAADGNLQSAQNALDLIESIRNDPNREWATGGTSLFNRIPGTEGYTFQSKVEQAKGGAFLAAIDQMRGLGALSNNEGAAATAAVNRMDTATTEKGFLDALADYEKIVRQGYAKAEAIIASRRNGGSAPAHAREAQADAPASPPAGSFRWNPATNSLEPM